MSLVSREIEFNPELFSLKLFSLKLFSLKLFSLKLFKPMLERLRLLLTLPYQCLMT